MMHRFTQTQVPFEFAQGVLRLPSTSLRDLSGHFGESRVAAIINRRSPAAWFNTGFSPAGRKARRKRRRA